MRSLTGLVIGTAGHIDHGKTSLVYALTGIDTDRLKEEKQRGISIDLGFAQMQLPDGRTVSFIDVPGHERFVRNMLAGAAGMEAVMLIVAASESVMPQTREHFHICQLLGLRHGLVVLTKCDLATPDQIAQARIDVQAMVANSFLAQAPVVEFSSVTKAGRAEMIAHLSVISSHQSARDIGGLVRMPIDRSFSVKGYGPVVTGTLLSGVLSVGDTLEILPNGVKVRVRGLQSQHAAVEQVKAGQRMAVNLVGIDHHTIKRGNTLAAAGTLASTRMVDVELRWNDMDALPSPKELFTLHAGTAEVNTRISLHRNGSLPPRFARLRLGAETVVLPGDRFVLRRPSPAETVGGGVVIDAFPPKRITQTKTCARLDTLQWATLARRIEVLLEESVNGRSIADLIRSTGASRAQVQAAIAGNAGVVSTVDERAVTKAWVEIKRSALVAWLREFHKANPNATGAPLAASRMGLDANLAALVFKGFDAVRVEGEAVSLAAHRAEFSPQEIAALQKMEKAFRTAGFQPPAPVDVMSGTGVDTKTARALLEALVKRNRLVRLPGDMIFHADVIGHIRNSLAQHKGRRFSVVEFKEWTNVSRKFAIPLLEYLDQQRVTRRDGDARVVL